MADASARGWGPGWPTDRRKDMAWITVRGVTCPAGVHKTLAPLVGWLFEETLQRGYDLRPGWCWGYCNRPIRGTSVASNHSWGLAVDLNAPTNPMVSPLRTDMPKWMVQLWKDNGFAWGGDYTGRKDAMHMEYMGRPADVPRIRPSGTGAVKIEGAGVTRTPGAHVAACLIGKGSVQVNEKGEVFCYQTSYHGGYTSLKPEQRQGTRLFVGVEPDTTNAPDGYCLIADDGALYLFPLQPVAK
jgi:D-alanyl-D-alanine carboxypeptidase-like protein